MECIGCAGFYWLDCKPHRDVSSWLFAVVGSSRSSVQRGGDGPLNASAASHVELCLDWDAEPWPPRTGLLPACPEHLSMKL